jgi:hypothetical protein
MKLKEAAAQLGIPYPTARARHARALGVLHEHLVAAGITRAPRPLVAPESELIGLRTPSAQNDTDPDAEAVADDADEGVE